MTQVPPLAVHRDVVAGRHRRHALADPRDLAGALVTVDHRVMRERQVTGPHVLVGVAHPAGSHLDHHFAGAGSSNSTVSIL